MSDIEINDNQNKILEKVKELRNLLIEFQSLDETGYLVTRFVPVNYKLPEDEFVSKFLEDQETRIETRRKEEHRQNHIIEDVAGWSDEDKQNLLIQLTGNASSNDTSTVKNEVV